MPSSNILSSQNPGTQDINVTDESSGVGQALNVTHNGSRTINDVPLSWSNGSTVTYNISLGGGWEMNSVQANITSLTDTRNWLNGSFDYGISDGNNSAADNDNGWNGLNWTFSACDYYYNTGDPNNWPYQTWANPTNNISGNYNDSTSDVQRNCLELQIQGHRDMWDWGGLWANRYFYGYYDQGNWSCDFNVPRGTIRNAYLNFSANAWHVINLDIMDIRFSIDQIPFYSVGIYSLEQLCGGPQQWREFSIPLNNWINNTNLFPSSLDARSHNFTAQMIFANNNSWWEGTNVEYQQVFLSDLKLFITSDVDPTQLNVTLNELPSKNSRYGSGMITQCEKLIGSEIGLNFTSCNNASYEMDMRVSLDINASCTGPTTCSELNLSNTGTKFSVTDNSNVLWDFYSYFFVPTGFVEKNFTLHFPGDWSFTWVSTPQEPAVNQINKCTVPVSGQLCVPVSLITATPDGFWKFRATAPNYISDVFMYRNSSCTPGPSDWEPCQSITAGDFLNISAQTFIDKNFTDFSATQAQLDVKFPNGTLWFTTSQIVVPSSDGIIQFAPLQIPLAGTDYVAGDYKLFIRWNNSIGLLSSNETGLFLTSLRIVHPARLELDEESTQISNLLVSTSTTIKISFLDAQSGEPIEGATLSFVDLTGKTQYFTEYAPGYYIAEVYAPPGQEGSRVLTVQVSHPYFSQATVTIPVEVVSPGISPLVYYLMGAAIVALLAAFLSYQRYFKYPKIIRGIRGLRGRIGRGKVAHVPVKSREVSFTVRYGGIVKQGGRLAVGIRSEFSVREFPEQPRESKSSQPPLEIPPEKQTQSSPYPVAQLQPPAEAPLPLEQTSPESVAPAMTTQHLKDQIVHMQQLAQILAETQALQTKSADLANRVKQAEAVAAPNLNLIQLVTDLEKRFEKQRVLLEQEQAKNKQVKGIQQIVKIAAGVEARIQALQQELAQLQAAAVTGTTTGGLDSLIKDLQQKIAQLEPLLKEADARVSQLEHSLKWRTKK